MNEWAVHELASLRVMWPELEFHPAGQWVLISDFAVPEGWSKTNIDVAVRIPENLPGQEPYGFWVRDGLTLAGGAVPSNYTISTEPPFPGTQWGQFSWAFDRWAPGVEPGQGTGMVHFVQSVAKRLSELN